MNGAESKHQNGARIVTDDGCAVADLLTLQGLWTEAQYFKLTNSCNHLVEFTDGQLEILPMPTDRHQSILKFLFRALLFVEDVGGLSTLQRFGCAFGAASFASRIYCCCSMRATRGAGTTIGGVRIW